MRYRLPSSPSLTHAEPRPTAMSDGRGSTPIGAPAELLEGSIGVAVPATGSSTQTPPSPAAMSLRFPGTVILASSVP